MSEKDWSGINARTFQVSPPETSPEISAVALRAILGRMLYRVAVANATAALRFYYSGISGILKYKG